MNWDGLFLGFAFVVFIGLFCLWALCMLGKGLKD